MDVTELRKRLQTYDQEHLLNFWNDLKEDEKKALYQELNQLDLDYVTQSFERCVSSMEAKAEKLDDHMAPLPSKFKNQCCQKTKERFVWKNSKIDRFFDKIT